MKCFLFGVLLVVCHVFYAQEHKTTTLYRYGKPLVTCETNFENLFSNVPKYIENNDDLDLLSYQFIGVAKNVNHVKKLLKKNFSHYPQWAVAETYPGYVISGKEKKSVGKSEVKLMPAVIPPFNIKEVVKTIANEYVSLGDRIYLLRFVYNLETFEQYIFVHPDTKEVVTKATVFGYDIRLSHFDYCNKNGSE